jgi:titin
MFLCWRPKSDQAQAPRPQAGKPKRRRRRVQPQVEALEDRRLLAVLIVTNTLDSGLGSLRQAILDADDTQRNPGQNTILFNISNSGTVQTIAPASQLPALTDPDGIILDGTSEPLYAGTPLVELHEPGQFFSFSELVIAGGNSTVKGLAINSSAANFNAPAGIELRSDNNTLQGNVIGTDAAGTVRLSVPYGVLISGANNTIGGTLAAARNVISGNRFSGVWINGGTGNRVEGNFLGTNAAGTVLLGNTEGGVIITSGSDNTIGGSTPGAGNVISGNSVGVAISNAQGNVIQGNLIGTDVTGTVALNNFAEGVDLGFGSSGTTVGGTAAGAGNVISGNRAYGVRVDSSGNVLQGNLIGTDAAGTAALRNALDGVVLQASNNTIGGTAAGAGNVISGNGGHGVSTAEVMGGTTGNVLEQNAIGTTRGGTAALPNVLDGVHLIAATATTIGGTAPGAGNVISGNGRFGVFLEGVTGCVVQQNAIGTDVAGTAALPNALDGVFIIGGAGNTIGGSVPGAGNLISGNGRAGVLLTQAFQVAANHVIQGNRIGTDRSGMLALANALVGVYVLGGSGNTIGGPAAVAGNLIAGNGAYGVLLVGTSLTPLQQQPGTRQPHRA